VTHILQKAFFKHALAGSELKENGAAL